MTRALVLLAACLLAFMLVFGAATGIGVFLACALLAWLACAWLDTRRTSLTRKYGRKS